jgi:hypothetical protein
VSGSVKSDTWSGGPFRPIQLFLLILLIPLYACATLSPVSAPVEKAPAASPGNVIPRWQPFAEDTLRDASFFEGKTDKPRLEFWALRVNLQAPGLRILVGGGPQDRYEGSHDDGGDIPSTRVSSFVRRNGLLAGINASPFDPVSGKEGEKRTIVGITISDGVLVSGPNPAFDALIFYADGRAAIVPQSELTSIDGIRHALGGFHQILKDNEAYKSARETGPRHPRSAAGISADGNYLYLLVIDGRRPGSIGATEAETAAMLKQLGSWQGINFDGGGSSALALRYPDGKVRTVNTPIHSGLPGRERGVASCLGIGTMTKSGTIP